MVKLCNDAAYREITYYDISMLRSGVAVLLLLSSVCVAQEQSKAAPAQVPVISGDLGDCTADLRVTDVKDQPVSNAKIALEIKYGFGGFHRTSLEVFTNVEGKARFEGLPEKSRGPLAFTASYQGRQTTVMVEPREQCHGSFTAVLPNQPLPKPKDDE
jgi:hypothetical protein